MAATTSNVTSRKPGFDFAALTASGGNRADEVTRLREALETLAELVIAHGVMDAKTLESIVGDLIQPPMVPVALSAPLPPPAPSAAEAILKGVPKPSPIKAAPVAVRPQPAPVAKPQPQQLAQAFGPTPQPIAKPQPVVVQPQPVVVQPQPVVVQPQPEPAPVVGDKTLSDAPAVPLSIEVRESTDPVVPPSTVSPVVASPFPSEPKTAKPARKNPFDARDAQRLEAELADLPAPVAKPQGLFARLFGRKKTSPAAVAKAAASVEFTERMPKLPVDGLYAEQQRATELSFPPPSSVQRPKRAAAPRKKTARPANGPTTFCDRCWRRMDATGVCKTCSPLPNA